MVIYWSLNYCQSPQVSRTHLSILANLKKAVVLMVPIHPMFSNSCSHFSKPLWTVSSTQTTVSVTLTFMFHRFFSLALAKLWSIFSFLGQNFIRWGSKMFYHLEYMNYFFNLYCYIYNILINASFDLFQVFIIISQEPINNFELNPLFNSRVDCFNSVNYHWEEMLNYSNYSLLFLSVVRIESATSWRFPWEVH